MTTSGDDRLLLTVDVGNTNTVLGLHAGTSLRTHFRLSTRRGQTEDECVVLVRALLSGAGVAPDQIGGAVVASVVPPLTPVMVGVVRALLGVEALIVEPGIRTGLPILYDPPGDVGADRIVNAVAAFDRFGGPVVVVDFGTATTLDVVSGRGEYLGGVICPGIGISADALFQRAARLPRVEVRDPGAVIGRTTVGSIQSGLYYGYAAMVEGLIQRIRDELDEPVHVVGTGGYCETLAREIPSIECVDPVLTLTGLRLLHERNILRTRP